LKRIVSKNHLTTVAKMTAELNIHLQDPVSTKMVNASLKNPMSTVELQLLKFLLLKTMIIGEKMASSSYNLDI